MAEVIVIGAGLAGLASAIDKTLPACLGTRRNHVQSLRHLGVDFLDDRLQQALLVAEMVVERAARQARRRREIIHRGFRIADGAEGMTRGGDQLGARFGDHFRARLDHLIMGTPAFTYVAYLFLHTLRILIDIRRRMQPR